MTDESLILTIRPHTGASGDMLLAGLATLNMDAAGLAPDSPQADEWLAGLCRKIMPDLAGTVVIRHRAVNHVAGWHAVVNLPHEHEHRNLADILGIIDASAMAEAPKGWAKAAFEVLAAAEAAVHGVDIEQVHFHEAGALDSVLDVCLVCELFALLSPSTCVCGPLPMADGEINCAHGLIPAPAPAVLRLLADLPVRPFEGSIDAGELVTPTAAALLRALPLEFGPWPAMRIRRTAIIYGQKYFHGAANGLIFALGA